MDEDDDQDIYDDGTSITNRRVVGRIKSIFEPNFEPAMQGPKPSLPSKPAAKPPTPIRSADTKPTTNGDFPFNNNNIPKKTAGEIANKNKDVNSMVKNSTSVPQLNSEFVSRFNSMKNKPGIDDKPSPKPPWQKQPDVGIKPLENKNIPSQGLASRLKKFQQVDSENSDDKTEPVKPLMPGKIDITVKKDVISGMFQPKLPPSLKSDNKPPPTPIKPESKQPPPTPRKPTTPTEQEVISPSKPKPFSVVKPSPSGGGDPQSELMRAIQKRKESMGQKSENEQTDTEPQLRNMKRGKSIKRKSFTRNLDNKKFFLVEISSSDSPNRPPPKPSKILDINLDTIVSEYKKNFKRKFLSSEEESERPQSGGFVEMDEEIYEELPDDETGVDFPPPPPEITRQRQSTNRPVSMIPPMTEDEECDVVYDDGISAQSDEVPPPVIPGRPPRRGNLPEEPLPEPPVQPPTTSNVIADDPESDGELYEPLDDIINEVAKLEEKANNNTISTDNDKTEQLSEKERKKKEKEEKKRQEEERKKQEKRAKELKSKFKIELSELEECSTKGAIKEDAKGKGKDLAVTKDQRVIIICMDKRNPKGRWLVKLEENEDIIGYVDSNNVEVDNNLIRSVMLTSQKPQTDFADDGEDYEVPEQDEVYAEAL
ncbi:proteoglycan 4-like isoform X3 [Mytilus trossulus]|uniref:proteoglycan 4-like isoform X3 n=1 Tax=Mytilus trossulus TaxID=6551 RepID=UPI00300569A7